MKNTEKKTKINSVHYCYIGTDAQFESFVKSVVKDYITDNSLLPDEPQKLKIPDKKSA